MTGSKAPVRTPTTKAAPAFGLVMGALAIVYVVWGSTYLGIRVVVETMPSLISGGIRFAVCALLMGLILAIRKGPAVLRVTREEAMGALFTISLAVPVGIVTVWSSKVRLSKCHWTRSPLSTFSFCG